MTARELIEESSFQQIIERLSARGPGALRDAEKVALLQDLRGSSPEVSRKLDEFLMAKVSRCQRALRQVEKTQRGLEEIVEKLCAPPWLLAIFLGFQDYPVGRQAVVWCGRELRVVGLGPDVSAEALGKGEAVLLSQEGNTITASAGAALRRGGETAAFDRWIGEGRLVIKHLDQEIVLEAAASLENGPLQAGDLLRFDRDLLMAFEKVERSPGEQFYLENTPTTTFDEIGGLDLQIAELQRCLALHRHHPDAVNRYRLRRVMGVLLVGPSGTGKTMMARALANWTASLTPTKRCRFLHVKPGAHNSMWFGQTEANYRETFRVAREAARREPDTPVLVFFDEVDAVGLARGAEERMGSVEDRCLMALTSELDGLEERGGVFILSATNRPEALDPALTRPGRLADRIVHVPRPNRNAARAIFAKYLPPGIPYAGNGHDDGDDFRRWEIIDAAVSRAYSPNGDSALATLTFRDGKQRLIQAADLISGSLIANIARAATERACLREIATGEAGLSLEDVLTAMAEELESAARLLRPSNAVKYLTGLPQDMPVASVVPVARRVGRPHRFLQLE